MKELRLQYDSNVLCQVLEVSRGGYYRWASRKPSKRAQDDSRFGVGYPGGTHAPARQLRAGALAEGLQDHGYQVGVGRIKRLRRTLNIRCVQKYKFKATTNSNHDLLVAPNRLEQNFVLTRLAVWVTDISVPQRHRKEAHGELTYLVKAA